MKLQSKIIWISCLVVVAAMLVSDTIIWNLMRKTMQKESLVQELEAVQAIEDSIYKEWGMVAQADNNEELLKFILKRQNDDYIICLTEYDDVDHRGALTKMVYNRTVLTQEELENFKYATHGTYTYANYKNGRKDYLVLHSRGSHLQLYFIRDVSYVNQRLRLLAVGMLGTTIAVTIVVILLLNILVGKALGPIKELSESARAYSDGNYDVRVDVRNQDEIGELSNNFNQMAEAIAERTEALQESERRKTLFMGNLTHELRTPMTAISGYAQTLLMAKLEPEEEEAALTYIYSECGRLEQLSRKMMELLELEQGNAIQLEELSVSEIFEQTGRACKATLEEGQITLHTEEHGECVTADYDLMVEVLVNLINNAKKASSPGTEIWLRVDKNSEGKTYITVRDQGCGIPKEEQDKILEPFYMIDKSRSRKNGGAGLGLALVKLILDRQNMTLSVESEVGKGTTMIIKCE